MGGRLRVVLQHVCESTGEKLERPGHQVGVLAVPVVAVVCRNHLERQVAVHRNRGVVRDADFEISFRASSIFHSLERFLHQGLSDTEAPVSF